MSAEQVRKHFVLDTNVLLHNPQSIFKFEEHQVVIPLTVLEELDTFKKNNDEKGRNARQVIRSLDRLRGVGHLFEGVVWNEQGGSIRVMRFKPSANYDLDLSITDNRIIGIAHALQDAGLRAIFVSKDINARVKCDAIGITAEDFEADRVDADWLNTGFITSRVPRDLIDDLYSERQLPIARIEAVPGAIPQRNEDGDEEKVTLLPNHFISLVDENDPSHTGLARRLADTAHIIPITGPRKPIYGVIARNVQQTMALDLLLDDEIKLVTLIGPAGTGKTLLARAVAHHTDCTFIRVSGAELVQKYIGEVRRARARRPMSCPSFDTRSDMRAGSIFASLKQGSRMVRELFIMAREAAPSIIFMDEIDSIGSARGGAGGGDSEVQRTMLELLNQLDGFEPVQNIKVR